ncbi:MAG TPA: hypothetical protein PK358_02895 [Spirochaetota bacterium]|nr:hypothetical protein [Spirochaetota bacterium]
MPNFRVSREAVVNFFAVLIFPFCIISLEAILFHLLMIVSNYLHATTIISIAMFGIAFGGLVSFYLLRINRIFVLSLSSLIFFVSIGLSYYGIVRLDNFSFPWLLIVPFFSGSVIVSSVFSRADSHKIYFVDLTASAAGVVYPIIAVSVFKSENTLIILSVLPLIFLIVQLSVVKKIMLKVTGILLSLSAVFLILWFLDMNMSPPREITADDFNNKVMPYITSPIDKSILEEVYSAEVIPGKMVLKTDEPYKEIMARNVINKTAYYPFVMDLSINYKPLKASEKNLKIYTEKLKDYTFLFSEDNLIGRVEYITKTDVDFLYINNGAFYDRVFYGDRGSPLDIRFPNYLYKANTFIMGASADGIVNSLKRLPGKTGITGVEFNPIIHKTMMSGYYFEKSARAYENTVIHRTEGRAYLKATDEKYDMITHMNNHAEHGAVCTLAPEYLHTVEGIREMLLKLTDRGLLIYEEISWSKRSDWAFFKFMNTIVTALHELGIENPERHIIVYRWDYWNYDNPGVRSVIIKRVPFSGYELKKNREFLQKLLEKEPSPIVSERNILVFPGMIKNGMLRDIITGNTPADPVQLPDYYWIDDFEKDILNYVENAEDREFVKSLYTFYPRRKIEKGFDFVSTVYNYKNGRCILKRYISEKDKTRYMKILDGTDYCYKMDISPVRDNKPFPFNVFKEKKEVTGILKIVGFLSLVIFIPVLLLIIVKYSSHRLALFNHSLFFISIGFGYMLVEIVLMQYMQRFIGIPTYSVIVTLGALLFFSGIGSLLSGGWKNRWVYLSVLAIPVVIFLYSRYLDNIFGYFAASSFNVRLAAGVAVMVPLSVMMGIPFPKAMEKIKKDISREYATLMYAISGAAGTIATTLALFLNVSYGFSFTFIIGMAAYITGAALLMVILRGSD